MLYMKGISGTSASTSKESSGSASSSSSTKPLAQSRNSSSANLLNEDDVDLELYKMDGRIKRDRDEK